MSPEADYHIMDAESGELIQDFVATDFRAGRTGALYAAARRARALTCEGKAVILSGVGIRTRRYSPDYRTARRWPYRIQCRGCGGWMYPRQLRGEEAVCWSCYKTSGIPESQIQRIADLARARRKG